MPRKNGTTQNVVNRKTAVAVAAGLIKKLELVPFSQSAKMALRVLDDLARTEPDLQVSRWYLTSPDNQIALFVKDWSEWCKFKRREERAQANTACTGQRRSR